MPSHADTIITNARILTMDAATPRAEALAISAGRIAALGDDAAIEALAGPDTRRIDAEGNSVLPGFIEAHMHLMPGAAEIDHLQLAGVNGFDALASAVRTYAVGRPDAPVLQAQGADYSILGVGTRATRHDLDRIIADRPFAMTAPDHHTMWANTRALELAGLLHGKKCGPGNEVVMGSDGLANGELREGEAFGPLLEKFGESHVRLGLATGREPNPAPKGDEREHDRAIMRRGLNWCARHGITSIQNMDGIRYQLELLSEIEAEGGLKCRVQIPFHFKNFMEPAELERASEMSVSFNSDWLRSGMVKFFMDGVIDSWTALMIEPYADRDDGWCSEPLFTQEAFNAAATEADRRGLQIAVHAIGNGAVRSVLDGYEAARKANGPRDSRHRIEHIEVIHPDDIHRFAELGVIASMQPPHPPGLCGFPFEPTASQIGKARWPYAYAWRTMKDAGAHVVFASDWPVSPIDPMLGIQAAMRRKPWKDGDPDQHFTLEEAIYGYTAEGAWSGFAEDRKGMLKPGYLADVVIMGADLEKTDVDALHEVAPRYTICGGKVTWDAAA